jgi:hypothetical protein
MGKEVQKPLKIKHIERKLDEMFSGIIDMNDWKTRPATDQRAAFLGRALAAYALVCLDVADTAEASSSVVDGIADEGIDAIYVDRAASIVYLIQSKWCSGGTKSVASADVRTFLSGVDKILSQDWDDFNSKIRAKQPELDSAVLNFKTHYKIVLVSPTASLTMKHAQTILERKLRSWNGTGGDILVSYEPLDIGRLHKSLTRSIDGSNVDITVTLIEWGSVKNPYWAYYGQTEVAEILVKQPIFCKKASC